jgi:hypothetical protein
MAHRDAHDSAHGLHCRRRPLQLATLGLAATLSLGGGPAALAAGGPGAARLAQATGTPPVERPTTIRGTIVAVEGDHLRVATPGGAETVTLVPPLTVTGATRASLADIGPGTFLGTAARAQPDGTFRALEVHIFDESMRGTGEGHRPMDAPGTTMTNAAVDAVVQKADGPLLTLKHKDGVTQVLVPPDTPIVRFGPGDPSLLLPGASVTVFRALRATDGSLSASRLTVGVNGTRLPM